jgi:hypothetical protein
MLKVLVPGTVPIMPRDAGLPFRMEVMCSPPVKEVDNETFN